MDTVVNNKKIAATSLYHKGVCFAMEMVTFIFGVLLVLFSNIEVCEHTRQKIHIFGRINTVLFFLRVSTEYTDLRTLTLELVLHNRRPRSPP